MIMPVKFTSQVYFAQKVWKSTISYSRINKHSKFCAIYCNHVAVHSNRRVKLEIGIKQLAYCHVAHYLVVTSVTPAGELQHCRSLSRATYKNIIGNDCFINTETTTDMGLSIT